MGKKMKILRRKVSIPETTMEVILVEDPKIGGFTASFAEISNIIAEGKDEETAINNLINTLVLVNRIVLDQ
ncbi:hypothetical protein KKH23_07305 [Patescibacteria group bacterium]|nr:hypothetical protein [Patescibacteria group bacterium]MBU1067592.1 hypothetical protein [Patescibacteria group bacterium]